jgi:hypothetical protein
MQVEIMRKRSEVLVIALVGKALSEKWWNSHNKAFDMTPEEKWKEEPEVVYNYLMFHADPN